MAKGVELELGSNMKLIDALKQSDEILKYRLEMIYSKYSEAKEKIYRI